MSQQITPEFVLGFRAIMLDGFKREAEITKKVIAAIPDAKSDYNPTRTRARRRNWRGISPTLTFSFWMELPT
jgi:hypothetical protein